MFARQLIQGKDQRITQHYWPFSWGCRTTLCAPPDSPKLTLFCRYFHTLSEKNPTLWKWLSLGNPCSPEFSLLTSSSVIKPTCLFWHVYGSTGLQVIVNVTWIIFAAAVHDWWPSWIFRLLWKNKLFLTSLLNIFLDVCVLQPHDNWRLSFGNTYF